MYQISRSFLFDGQQCRFIFLIYLPFDSIFSFLVLLFLFSPEIFTTHLAYTQISYNHMHQNYLTISCYSSCCIIFQNIITLPLFFSQLTRKKSFYNIYFLEKRKFYYIRLFKNTLQLPQNLLGASLHYIPFISFNKMVLQDPYQCLYFVTSYLKPKYVSKRQ